MSRYLKIWWILVQNNFRTQMSTSLGSAGYLLGKLLRFGFFLVYIVAIFKHVPQLKGYGLAEVVLFFMTFNLIDVGAQFLFRGLYGIKFLIEEGDFDKIITQPAHPLFRISSMGVDLLDLLTLIPILGVTFWTVSKLPTPITLENLVLYLFLLGNGLLISYSFHVVVAGLSVLTQEFEGSIWIYRDVMTLGRFPVNIYSEVIRGFLVTVLPIGVMISFPAQAMLGLLSWRAVLYAFLLGGMFWFMAQKFWRYTLREYASNSS